MFKRMFGGGSGGGGGEHKKAPPPPNPASAARTVDAIQKLGETEDLLNKRLTILEKKIALELAKPKEFLKNKDKRGALQALKKKKLLEVQMEAVENNIQRVNEQQGMLENQRMTMETMGALQYGAHASKQTMNDMKITDVDHVLEEIGDQADQMSQIQDAMAQPLGAAADLDMDELEKELAGLEEAELDAELLEPSAPAVAKVRPQQAQPAAAAPARAQPAQPARPAKTAAERELEELEAEMAS